MTDRKQQRKEFRRDINRTPKQGETVDGPGCPWMLAVMASLGTLIAVAIRGLR